MKQLLFVALVLCGAVVSAQVKLAPLPASKNKVVVIAHRGNHAEVPECTLEAFAAAIKIKADYVEVDVRTTKDGRLVVLHDATVNRMTNGTGNVKDLTWDEIRQLEVVGKKKSDKKVYRIPLLEDVLKLCKNKINIYLDFKDADVQQTWEQIQAAGMEKRIAVYVNRISQYNDWRKYLPQIPIISSAVTDTREDVTTEEQLAAVINRTPIEVFDNVHDKNLIAFANKNHVAVWLDVDSKNEGPDAWDKVLSTGIQGIQTDNPKPLIDYLKKKGLR